MTLRAGTAHLWWLETDELSAADLARWQASLDPEERARAARFVQPADTRQFIAAHALLRGMLCHFAGLAAPLWRFVTESHGKPALHPAHGMSDLAFNISHTRGAVACGLTLRHAIGVDIEDRFRPGSHVHLADAYFAPAEVATLRAAPAAEQEDLFFVFWTLKESYIKAVGKGLSLPLDQFAFSLSPPRIAFDTGIVDDPGDWQFATTLASHRHRLSVAVRHRDAPPVMLDWRRLHAGDIGRLMETG
ncbi:MAG: 4'-phosphopantetheinyl transferase superfamily protein [Acetobacteraceae bacterium]